MGYVMFLALSAIAAMLYNAGIGWFTAKTASTSIGTKYSGSYWFQTAVTAVAFFLVIIAAATAMNLLPIRKSNSIPEVV